MMSAQADMPRTLETLEEKLRELFVRRKETEKEIIATRGAIIRMRAEAEAAVEEDAEREKGKRELAVDPKKPIAAVPAVQALVKAEASRMGRIAMPAPVPQKPR